MATLWEKFIGSYPTNQSNALTDLKDGSFPTTSFSDFAKLSTESLSDTFASLEIGSSSTSYTTYLLKDFANKAQQALQSCDNALNIMESIQGMFPGNVQNSVAHTLNDMVSRGTISYLYELKPDGGFDKFSSYFLAIKDSTTDMELCAHPFIRSAAQNLLSNANTFITDYKYSFSLSLQLDFGLSGSHAFNAQNMGIIIHTSNIDMYGTMLYSGIPSASGLATFNFDHLNDGDAPLPTTFSGYATPVFNGTPDTAHMVTIVGMPIDPGAPFTITITLPAGIYGDNNPDINTLYIATLTGDTTLGLNPPTTSLQTIFTTYGISTLADIRRIGGLANWIHLPTLTGTDVPLVIALDKHARLEPVTIVEPVGTTKSYLASQAFIQSGLISAKEIAEMPMADIVKISETYVKADTTIANTEYGQLNAVNAYTVAKVQASLALDYLHGYITIGQSMMESTDPFGSTPYPSTFLESLEERCSCTDCETALSPQAYMFELTQYIGNVIKKYVDSTDTFIDITFLEQNLFQPFDQLAGRCIDVDDLICQQRLAVEIVRSYYTAHGGSGIAPVVESYANSVYNFVLNQLGTSVREIKTYKNQLPKNIRAFADKIGVYLNETDPTDITSFFNLLLPDLTVTDPDNVIEELYGIRSTAAYQLSQGLVNGTSANTISRWRLKNAQFLKHTDSEGTMYITLTGNSGSPILDLYSDSAKTKLVASGTLSGAITGTIKIGEENNSGINGYFDVASVGSSSTYDLTIKIYSTLQSRMLRYEYEAFKEADFPSDLIGGTCTPVTQVAIDPDIVNPYDIYYPWESSNPVYQLWKNRLDELNSLSTNIDSYISSLAPALTSTSALTGIASDQNGNLFFAQTSGNKVKFSLLTGTTYQPSLGDLSFDSLETNSDSPVDLYFNFNSVNPNKTSNDFLCGNEVYLQCKETTGSTAADSTENGLNGSLQNMAIFSPLAFPDYGAKFNISGHTNAYLKINSSGLIDNMTVNQRTLELWFKSNDITSSTQQVLYREGDQNNGFIVYIVSNYIYCGYIINGVSKFTQYSGISSSKWTQLVFVLNATGLITDYYFQLYINGVFIQSIAGGIIPPHAENTALGNLGGINSLWISGSASGNFPLNGLINNFRLWNKVFSNQDIIDLYNSHNSTNHLLIVFGGSNDKIGSYSLGISNSLVIATIDWHLTGFIVTGYTSDNTTHIRQDTDGNLLLLDATDGKWMKFYLPSALQIESGNDIVDLSGAEKPFRSPKGTLLVPDSKLGTVYEIITGTGELLKTIGYDLKRDNEAYLKCNEITGTTAADSTGNGLVGTFHGTPNLPSFSTTAAPDYGVNFTTGSTNAYVQIASSSLIDNMNVNERTVELWFKCNDVSPSTQQVLYREGQDDNGFIAYIQNGSIYCGYITSASLKYVQSNNIASSSWTQLVFVLDATSDNSADYNFSVYINSNLVGTIPTEIVPSHGEITSLGNLGGVDSRWTSGVTSGVDFRFNGLIHNFRLWNRVFSAQDVADLYNSFSNTNNLLIEPIAVCTDPSGIVFVADQATQFVSVFDNEGQFLRKFGGYNSTSSFVQGKFTAIADITISDNGLLFILDNNLNQIQVFDEFGSYIRAFGQTINNPSIAGTYAAIDIAGGLLYLLTNDSGSTINVLDLYGNYHSSYVVTGAITPIDIAVSADGTFTALYNDAAPRSRTFTKNIFSTAAAMYWYVGDLEQNINGALVQLSPVVAKGITSIDNATFYVTDYNSALSTGKSRVFKLGQPVVTALNDIVGGAIDRQNRIYIAQNISSVGAVLRYDASGTLDTSFSLNTTTNLTGLTIDGFNQIYLTKTDGSNSDISIYTDEAVLINSNAASIPFAPVTRINMDANGKVIATGGSASENATAIDAMYGFGPVLSYVFSSLTIQGSFNFQTYSKLWWTEQQGKDMQSQLDQLYLTSSGYRYLENFRESSSVASTSADWVDIKNILVNSYKLNKYAIWRSEEGLDGISEKITYSPYYFNYNTSSGITFQPVPFRASISQRQAWLNRVASRFDQISQLLQAQVNTASQSDDKYMSTLRDGIINLLTISGATTLSQKADKLRQLTQYDFKFNCCQSLTRISAAINTLQDFVEAIRDTSYSLSTGNIQITNQDFDTKWAIMGTYSAWRAATFVYLYPENLLQPDIKPLQSNTFSDLVNQIEQGPDFNSDQACEITRRYSSFFEDLCNLNLVGVSRTTEASWSQNDCGAEFQQGYPISNYVFGQSQKTGKLYYTVTNTDTANNIVSILQMWQEVPNLADYKVVEFCGVSNFRQSINICWLYIFFTAYDKNEKLTFGYLRFDTFKKQWDQQFVSLDSIASIAGDELSQLSIRTIHFSNMWFRPYLAVMNSNYGLYYVWMTTDGTSIETGSSNNTSQIDLSSAKSGTDYKPKLHAVIDIGQLKVGNKANSPKVVIFSSGKDQTWTLNIHGFTEDNARPNDLMYYNQDSSYKGFLLNTVDKYLYIIYEYGKSYYFDYISISDFSSVPNTGNAFPQKVDAIFNPEVNDPNNSSYFNMSFIQQNNTNDQGQSYFNSISGNVHSYKNSGHSILFNNGAKNLAPNNSTSVYRATPQKNADALMALMSVTTALYQQNIGADSKIMEFVAEAFYYLPMLIAGKLQQNGYYLQALDWYRLVYNYTAAVANRKIYYGLSAEKYVTGSYNKAELYLDDTINPHTVALSRPEAYTRYTVESIVNCLLDYADSEFTADTAESVSHADQLYNQALKLINEFTYNSPVTACDTALDGLTVVVKDPLWLPVWQGILSQLSMVESPSDLSTLIYYLNHNISSSSYATDLTNAQVQINAVLKNQQGVDTITTLSINALDIQRDAELYVQSQKVNVFSSPLLYAGIGSESSNAMTYTFKKLAATTTTNFVSKALTVGTIDAADIRTASSSKTINGLNSTFNVYPTGNVVVNQSFGQPMTQVRGAYDVSPVFEATTIPSAYVANAPFVEQFGLQIVANNPNVAYSLLTPVPMTMRTSTLVYCVPRNPVMQMLQFRSDVNLFKIRNCRDIAGAVRELAPFSGPTDATSGIPVSLNGTAAPVLSSTPAMQPTQFRYSFLIDRAKNLCNIAQQMESSMLASLEKLDAENYAVFKANQDVALTRQQIQLQNLQVKSANDQVTVVNAQLKKVQDAEDHYNSLITNGRNSYEKTSLNYMIAGYTAMVTASTLSFASALAATTEADLHKLSKNLTLESKGAALLGEYFKDQASYMQSMGQWQRQLETWNFQKLQADDDKNIVNNQLTVVNDQKDIVNQQLNIAKLQSQNAQDSVNFLKTKFTNAALYAFMSKQLSAVYKFFLNEATAVARQAATQLSFERQIDFSNTIANNYYNPPTNGQSTNPDQSDMKGLTGSARLLKDIFVLDDNAVNTEKRKLQVSKIISLASIDPVGFQQFRTTGSMPFTTTHDMFDHDFPGQYLRLINSVSVSVVALTSPVDGIRATLRSLGSSRVIVDGDFPQEIVIRSQPDMVTFTAPTGTNGSFELTPLAPELYKPFENSGVVMNWVFELPQYTNRMDYSSIADVQININYTAEYNDTLRSQVLKKLSDSFQGKRSFSIQLFYPDAWYDLNNPADGAPRTFSFTITQDNFPINMSNFVTEGVTMFFQADPPGDGTVDLDQVNVTSLSLLPSTGAAINSSHAIKSINNLISTAFVSGLGWLSFDGNSPMGKWTVTIDNTSGEGINRMISEGRLKDIIFVIDYTADLPSYNLF